MYLNCKHCHDRYDIGSDMTRQLLLTYCTEQCAINDGMGATVAREQFEERVPVRQQPAQPLDELETLRHANAELHKYLRCLLSADETYIIRATVESILSHQNESDRDAEKGDAAGSCFETNLAGILENAMEFCNLTLKEDENDAEIVHVYQHDRRIQTFSTAEWQWQYDDGTWPWEHEEEGE